MLCSSRCLLIKLNGTIKNAVNWNNLSKWTNNHSNVLRGRCVSLMKSEVASQVPKKFEYKLFSICKFHTSRNCKALPPVLVLILRPIVNVLSVLLGRGLRKWWQSLSPSRRKQLYENVKRHKYKLIGGAAVIPVTCYAYYELHLVETPITKRKRFIVFTKKELLRLANVQRDVLLEEHKKQLLPSDHYFYKKVARVAVQLINKNEDLLGKQDAPWMIFLIDDDEQKNAFVLPNKCIFVCTGMLNVCSNDDQLAVILAHEIAHVALSHMEENLSKTHLIQMMLFIPFLLIWTVLPNESALFSHWVTNKVADLMIHLPFSRGIETEADEVGLMMAAKACYDVRESSALWGKMDKLSSDDNSIEWLSTHPSYSSRKNVMDCLIPRALQVRENCLCPPLFGARI
ncbi:metalloendopeptidase OMA1, mitochondrial-like [Hetaerina americana]|uniref:metalloendopeptidase OMA1, mitochondrial-like n=1 Tax=Hetaerina americana TaxID=62018 RepID=UPI003A7F3C41